MDESDAESGEEEEEDDEDGENGLFSKTGVKAKVSFKSGNDVGQANARWKTNLADKSVAQFLRRSGVTNWTKLIYGQGKS